jgi:AcrR family transcriptional regulator
VINSRRRRTSPGRARRGLPRRAAAGGDDTPTRILDAAERLFAERGIEAVSVRSILAAAGVNPALAHYHFGNREGLVAELLRTRIAPVAQEIGRALDEVDARGAEATLEDVLRAYFTPSARCVLSRPQFGRLFAQLLYSPDQRIRELGRESIRGMLSRFAEIAAKRVPGHVEPKRLLLRLILLIGGPSHLSANWEGVMQTARRRLGPDVEFDAETLVEEFVTFAAAGLRAVGTTGGRKP